MAGICVGSLGGLVCECAPLRSCCSFYNLPDSLLLPARSGFLGKEFSLGLRLRASREIQKGFFCVEGKRRGSPRIKMMKVNGEDSESCCEGPNPLNRIVEAGMAESGFDGCDESVIRGNNQALMSTVGKSTNIVWQDCSVGKAERQQLLKQKGCVIWITGLSGSGKSTLACSLSRQLHARGKLTYILDGDNIRHGLNKDLSFNAEDRAENIHRIGEVAKLFADAGVICIASLISPYRRDRDACRGLLPDANFIEVFMNVPLEVCEGRDSKGLYKLARAGKIKGFTGIDDPYEPPLKCEIVIQQSNGICPSPNAMAKQVIAYLDESGFLNA